MSEASTDLNLPTPDHWGVREFYREKARHLRTQANHIIGGVNMHGLEPNDRYVDHLNDMADQYDEAAEQGMSK